MAGYSFAVRQHPVAKTTETADRFYFEIAEAGKQGIPSILCEVRRCGSGDEFEIIVWKDDKPVLAGERFPRKSLEDLAKAIEEIL